MIRPGIDLTMQDGREEAVIVLQAAGFDMSEAVMIACWGANRDFEEGKVAGNPAVWEDTLGQIRNLIVSDFSFADLERLSRTLRDIQDDPLKYCPAANAPC